MNKIALLLLVLLAINVSSIQNLQQGKLIGNLNDKLKKSHFGKAILGMIQLQSQAKGDLDQLYQALDLLKENLIEKKNQENDNFQSDAQTHQIEVAKINGLISQYANQLIVFQQELQDLQATGKKLQLDLQQQQGQQSTAQDSLVNENEFLQQAEIQFQQQEEDFEEGIQIIESAVGQLLQASLHADQASFLQINQDQYKNLGKQMQTHLQKMKYVQTSFARPISNFLIQMGTDSKQVSSDQIQQAITALNDLRDYFIKGLQELQADYATQTQLHQNLINNLKAQISSLINVILPQTSLDIETNQGNQDSKQMELNDANKNQEFQQSCLDSENESWDKRVQMNSLLIPEYDTEYDIIIQAEGVLKSTYGF